MSDAFLVIQRRAITRSIHKKWRKVYPVTNGLRDDRLVNIVHVNGKR